MSATQAVYDPDERLIARQLDAQHPAWAIWWGTGSRRFWAVPCWRGARTPIVDAPDPRELLTEMLAVEVQGRPRQPSGTWAREGTA